MKRTSPAAVAAVLIVLSATGCATGHQQSTGLRLLDVAITSGGDEHDEIGASDNADWWVIGRYPSNRVVRVNIRTGAVTTVTGLRREPGAPDVVTDAGRVEKSTSPIRYPNLDLDRTDSGSQLSVVGTSLMLSLNGGRPARVATGYPRSPDPEASTPFSAGTISDDGTVTFPTSHGIHQMTVKTGRVVVVSRGHSVTGVGVAASANGRFVVYAGDHDDVLRWDRTTGTTTTVSRSASVSGDFSVTDTGVVAFVANECNLTSAAPPAGAEACLYVTPPA